jgi:rhodanese-related sulfurtransferase
MAARLAVEKGYTNVHLYQEGMAGWGKAGYPFKTTEALPRMRMTLLKPDEMDEMIRKNPDILIVDIRDSESYNAMRYPYKNMVNIPFAYLDERLGGISKSSRIIVTCHSGKQALTAGPYLKGKGYDVVGCLEGGVAAWQKAGKPVEK